MSRRWNESTTRPESDPTMMIGLVLLGVCAFVLIALVAWGAVAA